MKKIGRTIAMILVLVMLASSLTSCFTVRALKGELAGGPLFVLIPIYPIFDLITSPIQILYWILAKEPPWDCYWVNAKPESQIYMANAEYTVLPEYYSLKEKISALPEMELAAITETINSLPGTELNSLTDAVISLPEEKKGTLIKVYNSMPESEIIASIERISALSEEEFISLVRTFYSMSDAELNLLIEKIKSLTETENVAFDNNLSETKNVSMANGLNHLERRIVLLIRARGEEEKVFVQKRAMKLTNAANIQKPLSLPSASFA